jgi:hypothetical protein
MSHFFATANACKSESAVGKHYLRTTTVALSAVALRLSSLDTRNPSVNALALALADGRRPDVRCRSACGHRHGRDCRACPAIDHCRRRVGQAQGLTGLSGASDTLVVRIIVPSDRRVADAGIVLVTRASSFVAVNGRLLVDAEKSPRGVTRAVLPCSARLQPSDRVTCAAERSAKASRYTEHENGLHGTRKRSKVPNSDPDLPFDEMLADCEERELESIGDAELAENLGQVMLDGFLAQ